MHFRRLPLLSVLFLFVLAAAAHAQVGVYGMFTVHQMNVPGNSLEPLGGTGGVYYDFKSIGPVRLGADLRGTVTNTKQGSNNGFNDVGTRVNSVLAGVRASARTPIRWIKPYGQVSGGWGNSNYGKSTQVTNNGLQYGVNRMYSGALVQGFVGVDLELHPLVDFRLAEFGIGSIQGNGSSHLLKSVGVGVVVHFP